MKLSAGLDIALVWHTGPMKPMAMMLMLGMFGACAPLDDEPRGGDPAAVAGSGAPVPGGSGDSVTATIYADNYFELYVNGERVAVDPLDFTPHQAVRVSFTLPRETRPLYAILASDYATDSGYEYTASDRPQLGDGGLIAVFSDGRVTDGSWRCYPVSYGPTPASEAAGCSANNLDACEVVESAIPEGWAEVDFDDSNWEHATEYPARTVGWGRAPEYRDGDCCTVTDPLTREPASPSCVPMEESRCLSPAAQSWGDAAFIWGSDLERVNRILCRSQP